MTNIQINDVILARFETLCVGEVIWEGISTAFPVWGDDPITPEIDGIPVGEPIQYSVKRGSTIISDDVAVTYSMGDGIYTPDAIFVMDSLTIFNVTRYVDPDGSDPGNDCADQGNPCATLGHAVDQAGDGDTIDLATGTYNESNLLIDKALNILGQGVVVQ